MNKKYDINKEIQRILKEKDVTKVKSVNLASWLEQEGILKDSIDRPGLPLRKLLRAGKIKNAYQDNGRFWFICREEE